MLRRLTLAFAVAAAAHGVAWAQSPAVSSKTSLLGVYADALANNADLAAAQANYAAISEVVPQARAGLLPGLEAGAESMNADTDVNTRAGHVSSNRSGLSYRASLSQPLFRADRWYQFRAAKAIDQQYALNLSAIEQNLILQSAEVYFGVLRAQDTLAASKAEEAAFARQLEQAQQRFDVGLSDKTDVLEAQASYDAANANRILAERAVADAFERLATFTYRPALALEGVEHRLPILAPVPSDAGAWVDTAAQQNLMLQASQYAVQAAEQTLRQNKAGHAPTLDAVAQYEKGDNDSLGFTNVSALTGYRSDAERTSIGLRLNVPIYSGGLTSSRVREAYHRLTQTEQEREAQRRGVVENTRNLYRAVNTDVATVKARLQAILSSQSALEATEVGYQVGTRNIIDVLYAQRQLYGAVRQYNDARYDYILNNLRLKQVAGTLAPSDLEALSQYLKADYDPDRDFLPPHVTDKL